MISFSAIVNCDNISMTKRSSEVDSSSPVSLKQYKLSCLPSQDTLWETLWMLGSTWVVPERTWKLHNELALPICVIWLSIEVQREFKVNIARQAAGKLKIDVTSAWTRRFILYIIIVYKGSIFLWKKNTSLVQDFIQFWINHPPHYLNRCKIQWNRVSLLATRTLFLLQ